MSSNCLCEESETCRALEVMNMIEAMLTMRVTSREARQSLFLELTQNCQYMTDSISIWDHCLIDANGFSM
jgi:hypothetical protein